MPWLVVFEADGKVYRRASVSLSLYVYAKPYEHKRFSNLKVLLDRTDIPDERYEEIYGFVLKLIDRRNKGEEVNFESELEKLLLPES